MTSSDGHVGRLAGQKKERDNCLLWNKSDELNFLKAKIGLWKTVSKHQL